MTTDIQNLQPDQKPLNNVRQYIREHLDEPLTREVLAAVAGFSVPHFHRIFTAQNGENIAGYIRRIRLERAGRKLRMGAVDITEVALAAGYDTHAAFSKAFQTAVRSQPERISPAQLQFSNPNPDERKIKMKIQLSSVFVNDQDKALKFYTEILGFLKKRDIPLGEDKWLTVVSPDAPEGVELLLEPNSNPAAQVFQKAIFEQGIPMTAFAVDDIQKEYARLKNLGVEFSMEPTNMGMTTVAIFEDTCGNLIQIYQMTGA